MTFELPRGRQLVGPLTGSPQPAPRHTAAAGAPAHHPRRAVAARCPRCGGDRTTALAPGRYRCDGDISWLEEEVVPDIGGHAAWGLHGAIRQEVRRYAPCEHEFIVPAAAQGADICTATYTGAACGAYAVGVCQEEGCGRPACSKHAAYDLDQLVCTSCQTVRRQARDEWREEAGARRREWIEERSAGIAAATVEQLANATSPPEILELFRAFHEDRKKRYVNAWSDPDRQQSFLDQVVPAWGRLLAARTPEHAHEVVTLDRYRVTGRGSDGGIVRRQPCFVSTRNKQRKFFMGERVTVEDAWAYTADTAYHLGEPSGVRPWGRFSAAPVLSGDFVVCRSVQPSSIRQYSEKYVHHCITVRQSRPLDGEEILQLLVAGHQRLCIGHGQNEKTMQLA